MTGTKEVGETRICVRNKYGEFFRFSFVGCPEKEEDYMDFLKRRYPQYAEKIELMNEIGVEWNREDRCPRTSPLYELDEYFSRTYERVVIDLPEDLPYQTFFGVKDALVKTLWVCPEYDREAIWFSKLESKDADKVERIVKDANIEGLKVYRYEYSDEDGEE